MPLRNYLGAAVTAGRAVTAAKVPWPGPRDDNGSRSPKRCSATFARRKAAVGITAWHGPALKGQNRPPGVQAWGETSRSSGFLIKP